jgi:hypothetical protein
MDKAYEAHSILSAIHGTHTEGTMSDPEDSELPEPGSTLGAWAFFVFELLGCDSPAFRYVLRLCHEHGAGYVIEMDSNMFLDHIARVAFTNDREGK